MPGDTRAKEVFSEALERAGAGREVYLNQACAAHTATVLPNGQVLAAGGEVKNSSGGFTILASAELYTP